MALRTQAQLAQDFPNTSGPLVAYSQKKLLQLIRDGFLVDIEAQQIIDWLAEYTQPFSESFAAPTLAYTGTAGKTTRQYGVVARYPIPAAEQGGAGNVGGAYQNELAGKDPKGRPDPFDFLSGVNVADNRTQYVGPASTFASIAATAVPLSATNYVTVTAPAIGAIPGTTFDVVTSAPNLLTVSFSGVPLAGDSVAIQVSNGLATVSQTVTGATNVAGLASALATDFNNDASVLYQDVLTDGVGDVEFFLVQATALQGTITRANGSTLAFANGATTLALAFASAPFAYIGNVLPGGVLNDTGLKRVPYTTSGSPEYPNVEVTVDPSYPQTIGFLGEPLAGDTITVSISNGSVTVSESATNYTLLASATAALASAFNETTTHGLYEANVFSNPYGDNPDGTITFNAVSATRIVASLALASGSTLANAAPAAGAEYNVTTFPAATPTPAYGGLVTTDQTGASN